MAARSRNRRLHVTLVMRFTIAALLTVSGAAGACGGAHQVYDPYYNDYHRWNGGEDRFYRQWEVETHRPHVDFNRRAREEQHSYFDWRHHH